MEQLQSSRQIDQCSIRAHPAKVEEEFNKNNTSAADSLQALDAYHLIEDAYHLIEAI